MTDNQKGYAMDRKWKLGLGVGCSLVLLVVVGFLGKRRRTHYSLRTEIKNPSEDNGEGKPEEDKGKDKIDRPVGKTKAREGHIGHLKQHPADPRIHQRGPIDFAAF